MNEETYDLVIIGGGCTGLALAKEFCESGTQKNILILEERDLYHNDRTWCYWAQKSSQWYQWAERTWSQWLYHHENKKFFHRSEKWHYCYLPSIRYYDKIKSMIDVSQSVHLSLSTAVSHIRQSDLMWEVHTHKGQTFISKQVLDTRPCKSMKSMMYQCFVGYEVELDNPVQQYVSIMQDMRSDHRGFRFNYIIPLGDKSYLFEHTRFSSEPYCQQSLSQECDDELYRLGIQPQKVLRQEYGVLPMGLNVQSSPWPTAGTSAGALRDASGYGFLRIQRWAHDYASAFLSTKPVTLPDYKGRKLDPFMDKIFLQALKDNAQLSPRFFSSMAQYCSPDSLVRFLSDRASFSDYFQIIRSLPPYPFLRSLFKIVTCRS